MEYVILAFVIFLGADILLRYLLKKRKEKKLIAEREGALKSFLQIDYTNEAKSLKRVEVNNPVAKILCIDDEDVILDSFRKILVLDGYNVDTVNNGQDGLNLLHSHHYDFVFTDLKMPEMGGVEVTQKVKQLRPDIDVVIITGYATVETAVECMKHGAMDYIQKPFTQDELLANVKKFRQKRGQVINEKLTPQIHITHLTGDEEYSEGEFIIPGGVFISEGHSWAEINPNGTVKIGVDDFASKMIGTIDSIEFPNLSMEVKEGQSLFSVKQGKRSVSFVSPVSGKVIAINNNLNEDLEFIKNSPYDKNWFVQIDASNLSEEVQKLKIGESAVSFYKCELNNYKDEVNKVINFIKSDFENKSKSSYFIGDLEHMDDFHWENIVDKFFHKSA